MTHAEIPREVSGAIFDLDDTLLDNQHSKGVGQSLHERSQLDALRSVGRDYDIPELIHVSAEASVEAFHTAPDHTHESGIWNLFLQLGLTNSQAIDFKNVILPATITLKEFLHDKMLFDEGEEVPGATEFARRLADYYGIGDSLAIASSATRANAKMFVEKVGITDLFPDERIMTKESVKFQKPHREVYDRAFTSLGLDDELRSTTAAFEDDPKGISSAVTAGLFTAAIMTRFSKEQLMSRSLHPHVVALTYEELTELFRLPKNL